MKGITLGAVIGLAFIVGGLFSLTLSKLDNLRNEIKYSCEYEKEKYDYCLKNHYTLEIKGTTKTYTEKCN